MRLAAWAAPRAVAALVLAACAMGSPAWALDAAGEFTRGTWALGLELSGGTESGDATRRLSYLALGPRVSYLPLDPLDLGPVKLALEPGLEVWLQGYRWDSHAAGKGWARILRGSCTLRIMRTA